ncbi:AAA family ATPase [Methanofollis sp. UBA420]|jgi:CO dehydrogenase maturation factor|uniref:ATP-binding protein n=1 Tax=Methanofollis sp. UBA420 TaxID=1915514 RepID=UPI00316AC660
MCDPDERKEKILSAARTIRQNTHKETERGFRVVVAGKGGVGKTTITAFLSRIFARNGHTVLAVDEDPQMNLPYAVGVPREKSDAIVPLTKNIDYVEEKTGARPGDGWGLMLTLNPDVSDVVERFGVRGPDGVNILVMGTVVQAATGCLCPENTLLQAVVRYINLREGEFVLMDTQAGVEHFGRSIAEGFDQAVLVTDPTFNAVQVVKHAALLARELGIPTVHLVVNRVRSEKDVEKVGDLLGDMGDIFTDRFFLPYEERLIECEPDVGPMLAAVPSSLFVEGLRAVGSALVRYGTKEQV